MDRQLKQRVVGAGLLVAFGVIFIPIFLDNGGVESPVPPSMNIPPAPTEDVSQRAPALGEEAIAEMETQADEDVELPPSRVQSGEGSAAEPTSLATPSASGEPPAAAETQEEAVPAKENGVVVEPPRMQPPEPRVVTQSTTVAPMVAEVRPAGHAAVSDSHAKPIVAKATGVKPAPKPSETKLAIKAIDVKPLVKPADSIPSDSKTLLAAVKPPVPAIAGWTVQLGSFASDINAKKLVDKLKAAGYKAYSEPRLEQGATVFKVRVGPTPGKAEAERLRQRIEGQFEAHGMLVPSH